MRMRPERMNNQAKARGRAIYERSPVRFFLAGFLFAEDQEGRREHGKDQGARKRIHAVYNMR